MACIGQFQVTDTLWYAERPMEYPRARRHALIPPNYTLSHAEAEEIVRTRIQQPFFPPPDPHLLEHIRPATPIMLYSPEVDDTTSVALDPTTLSHPSSSNNLHQVIKQHLRHPNQQESVVDDEHGMHDLDSCNSLSYDDGIGGIRIDTLAKNSKERLRKHSVFVINEELMSRLEARSDTPHISELPTYVDLSEESDNNVEIIINLRAHRLSVTSDPSSRI